MKHISKIYFLDSSIHQIDEITNKIAQLNSIDDYILLRKTTVESIHHIAKILQKNKKIKKISHFTNAHIAKSSLIHLASEKRYTLAKNHNVTTSFHSYKNLREVRNFKPKIVFISPVFATKTHPNNKKLGLMQAFKMGAEIRKCSPQTKIFLLGGMDKKKFEKIKKLDSYSLFYGYAFIRGF